MSSCNLRCPFSPLPLFLIGLLNFSATFPGRAIGGEEGKKSETKPLFEDKFDGPLAKEWSWLNENPDAWRIGKDGLELRTLPVQKETMNVLLGPEFKSGTIDWLTHIRRNKLFSAGLVPVESTIRWRTSSSLSIIARRRQAESAGINRHQASSTTTVDFAQASPARPYGKNCS